MDEHPPIENITGVNTFFFLTDYDASAKVLLPEMVWPEDRILPKFYELNFGLSDMPYHHEYEMSKKKIQLVIDNERLAELNKIIHLEKPVNLVSLAKKNVNTHILRNLRHAKFNDCELVVARSDEQADDLLYYWNRGLYEHKNIVYVTVDQLKEFSKDKFFGGVLYDMKGDSSIHVVSTSLNQKEIEELIENLLRPIAFNTNFQYYDISAFPYEVLDRNGLFERDYGESVTTQTLVSDNGRVHVPKLSFGGTPVYLEQTYVLDLKISQDFESGQQPVLFPLTTESQYIVKEIRGRVTLSRNLSIFLNSQQNQTDYFKISIPSFDKLVRQLICSPVIHGEYSKNKIEDIGPHDASNRLRAFIKSFNGQLEEINYFFSDKFWVDIFVELSTSEKVTGDSLTFDEILIKALAIYAQQKLKFVDRSQGWFNLENLTLGLKQTLTELTGYQVFFKGFKLKCANCSSTFWYHVNEVRELVNCRGCLRDFNLPVEPQFAYKLNDLIKNNIFTTKTSRDGNLTVIRALAALSNGLGSFQFSPQLNLYDDVHSNKPCGDLDIVINDIGKFVIGEAKHHSKGFFDDSMKSLKSLADIAEMIFPDQIVLACSEDEKNKLQNACKSLEKLIKHFPHKPKIEPLLLSQPDYWHIKSHRYFKY
ncbi:hypothetical protein M8998_03825 [Sphingobacterium sp. lm-10]|uniref:hypothetical protein n=1 Tax=Sphingobacterium sp. lm-10 TaxID=2944904 RepID=UPI002021E246|nr:hypothetical protein [Sphingobacterium sp. lm-10]MCL7987067.1 hypothetical protein [Sphingobacterium sp. lm-10]